MSQKHFQWDGLNLEIDIPSPRWRNTATALIAACVLCCAPGLVGMAWGSPSNDEPNATFETYSGENAEGLLTEVKKLYRSAEASVGDYEALINRGALARLSAKAVSETFTEIVQIDRMAEQLQWAGEPAGADIALRVGPLQQRINNVIASLLTAPGAEDFQKKLAQAAKAKSLAEQKKLTRIEKFLNDGDYPKAAKELFIITDGLNEQAIFLTGPDRREVTMPFEAISGAVKDAWQKHECALATEHLGKERDKYLQLARDSVALAERVATAVKENKPPLPDNASATGPEVFAAVAKAWQDGALAIHRARAFEWGRLAVVNDNAAPNNYANIETLHGKLNQVMMATLPEIIIGYTEKVSVEETEATYLAFLNSAVQVLRYTKTPELRTSLEMALSKFASRSSKLAEKIEYQRVRTQEVLRWRKRIATVKTNLVKDRGPSPESIALAAGRTTNDFTGLFVPTAADTKSAKILSETPPIIEHMAPASIGKGAIVEDVSAIGTDGKAGLGRYQDRVYVRVDLPDKLNEAYESLRKDLKIDEAHPPLTLDVAYALTTTRQGDLTYAGGRLDKLYLEAMITRFGTLPAGALPMLGFEDYPTDTPDIDPLRHVVLRFHLKPVWVAGEYFFLADLPAAPK